MALRPPCDYVIRRLLLATRIIASKMLVKKGYSQFAVARMLGVTQAAINKYLSTNEKTISRIARSIGMDVNEIEELARSIVEAVLGSNPLSGLTLFCSHCIMLRASGQLCKAHSMYDKTFTECDVCSRLLSAVTRCNLVLVESVKKAVQLLELSEFFPLLIPQVYSNIVVAKRNASTINDVVGIPGRIVRYNDRAKAVGEPVFGGSRHLAKILLLVRRKYPEITSALNIKFDNNVLKALNMLGLKIVYTIHAPRRKITHERDVFRDLSKALESLDYRPDVIIDLGGVGLEPASYVLGEDPMDTVYKTLRIAELYYRFSRESSK